MGYEVYIRNRLYFFAMSYPIEWDRTISSFSQHLDRRK